jgi:hypothetical protein
MQPSPAHAMPQCHHLGQAPTHHMHVACAMRGVVRARM